MSIVYGGDIVNEEQYPWTLSEALTRAANSPQNGALYIDKNNNEHFQSYSQLLENSKKIMTALRNHGNVFHFLIANEFSGNFRLIFKFIRIKARRPSYFST